MEKWVAGLAVLEKNKKQGRTGMVKHEIDTGKGRQIKQAHGNIPLMKCNEIKELVEEMKRSGIIESSSSPWSSNIVLVKKRNGGTKFCVHYRKLNDFTKKDSYRPP